MNKTGMKIWLLVGWLAIVPQLNGTAIEVQDIATLTVNGISFTKFKDAFNAASIDSEFTGSIASQSHSSGRSSRSGRGPTRNTYTFQIKDANSEIIQSFDMGTTPTATIMYATNEDTTPVSTKISSSQTIIFKKISSGPPPKTVTINIPAGTTSFKNVNIMDAKENPDVVSLFNGVFSKDLLTNGLTVTGLIENNGISWTYSGGATNSSTNSKPYELDMYFNPGGYLKPAFNVGDTIKIVGQLSVSIPKANLPIAGLWVFWDGGTAGPQANKCENDAVIINDIAKGYKIVGTNTGDTLTLISGSDTSVGKTGTGSTGGHPITAFQYNYEANHKSVNIPLLPGQEIVLQLGT